MAEHKGRLNMGNLNLEDKVLTPSGYEQVYGWAHINRSKRTDFIKISTKSASVEVTPKHFLFLKNAKVPITASKVKIGFALDSGIVERIKFVTRGGLYAPLTPSGKLIVDGVTASSYVALDGEESYLRIGSWKSPLLYHDLEHMFMAPYRLVCLNLPSPFSSVRGDPKWAAETSQYHLWLMKSIVEEFNLIGLVSNKNVWIQVSFLTIALPWLYVFGLLERAICCWHISVAGGLLAVLFLLNWPDRLNVESKLKT